MADSFNCPKCGAPLHYNSQEQGYVETINCPYCGETVVIPPDMRKAPEPQPASMGGFNQIDMSNLIDLEREAISTYNNNAYQAPIIEATRAATWSMTSCLVISLLSTAVIGVIIFLVFISVGAGFMSFFNSSTGGDNTSVPIGAFINTATIPATPFSTEAKTPTPAVNTTATAQVQNEATLTAQRSLANQQSNWPIALQEKFANNKLNWNTGTENNNLAVEDQSIAGNKYTWKFTSKKSMGSFSYPDMAEQQDVYVSVDMQMTTSSQNSGDQAGIIFQHSVKDKTFYFFSVNPNGAYSLSTYDGSNWNDLIPDGQTDQLKPKQVNHLAVSMQGGQILLIINNTVVNSFEDSQFTSGTAGLGLNLSAGGEDATVIFTNFYVRAPKK